MGAPGMYVSQFPVCRSFSSFLECFIRLDRRTCTSSPSLNVLCVVPLYKSERVSDRSKYIPLGEQRQKDSGVYI